MSILTGLRDRARNLFGRPELVGNHTDVVPRGRLDDIVFDNVRSDAKGFDRMVETLGQDYDYTRDLLGDLYSACLGGVKPDVRMQAELRPSHRPHVAIEKELFGTKEFDELRTVTAGDEYDSALAVMSMQQKLTGALDRTKEAREKAAEAQAKRDEASQHAQQAGQQQSTAEQAAQQAQAAEQQARADQQAAQQAQQAVDDALQALAADPNDQSAQEALAAAQGAQQAASAQAGQSAALADGAAQQAQAAAQSLESIIAAAEAALAGADVASQRADVQAASAMADMHQELRDAAAEATKERDEERSLFEAFGYGPGDLKRMDFTERADLAARLKSSRLAKFHDLIGGWRLMESAERRRKTQHGHNEVHGIELSNDLSRLLPSEIVAMATPELEDDFWKRFSQHQLQSVRLRGTEKVGRGAVIAVVDESGTMGHADMAGGATREAFSKALCLALLDRARSQDRDFVYIGFGSPPQQHMVRFPGGRGSLDDVMRMTEHFFNGGTHFETPLEMARQVIEDEFTERSITRADVMFITDGQAPISPAFAERWNTLRDKAGFRCWGVAVSAESSTRSIQLVCDSTRGIDEFTSAASSNADIFRSI